MKTRFPHLICLLCTFTLTLFITGCAPGPLKGDVKGTVTVNGKPFNEASIIFLSEQTGQGANADLGEDGSYALPEKLLVGEYTVYFAPPKLPEEEHGQPVPISMSKSLPEEYWAEFSSTLRANVSEGENNVPIDIKF